MEGEEGRAGGELVVGDRRWVRMGGGWDSSSDEMEGERGGWRGEVGG